MATETTIEWTQMTWNPLTGCTKISPGCEHRYAVRTALCLQARGWPWYQAGFALTLREGMVALPTTSKHTRRVFADAMADRLHQEDHAR